MSKPVILVVDDEPVVLNAVDRDLRRQYGDRFRVLRADSGGTALDLLRQLKLRSDPVALLLVDQRMPRMTGVEMLQEAMAICPAAKRALLTAYADTEVAIHAINEIRLDYYLMKPWDPPEQHLYPVLDDLLGDWLAAFKPPFEGVRVIGHRWSAGSHQVKDFLARNQVPYHWLEMESHPDAARLLDLAGADYTRLPVVLFPDGTHLVQPTNVAVAEKVGLKQQAGLPFYDLIIVGGGPAGLTGAVYGASEGLSTLLLEREAPGGQAGTSSRIENYLGFPVGLSGGDLARRAMTQALRFGAEILTPTEVRALRVQESYPIVQLADGSEVSCHAMLIATGVSYRRLDAPGVERLTGAGVYYGAATSEAASCKDEDVYIIGGANSAGQAAMHFSKVARTVTLLVRGDALEKGMSQYLIEQIRGTSNIRVRLNTSVSAMHGENRLESITLQDSATGAEETVPTCAVFIFIGASPRTEWVKGVLERDDRGFILTGPDLMREGRPLRDWSLSRLPFWLEASAPGVFVAGDVRHESIKRVASAVGEGAMAVQFILRHLQSL
jgi:thioredoxin reductase (NADPH)